MTDTTAILARLRAAMFRVLGRCDHHWSDWKPMDLRADYPGGPRSFHDFRRVCTKCGALKPLRRQTVAAITAREARDD
ncbi:MAG: hypothetical protein K2X46_07670 [Roseomonas sp.]|nr:hypothetical protein [Roseomonas sp.]